MVAKQVEILELEDVDLMEIGQLKTLIKDLIQRLKLQARSDNADTENDEEVAPKKDREGMKTFMSGFGDKNIGKPEPWDCEDEAVFKTWFEKLSAHMSEAGDKVWKKVIKHIGEMDEDDNFEAKETSRTSAMRCRTCSTTG